MPWRGTPLILCPQHACYATPEFDGTSADDVRPGPGPTVDQVAQVHGVVTLSMAEYTSLVERGRCHWGPGCLCHAPEVRGGGEA